MIDKLWIEHIGGGACGDCHFYETQHANEEREMGLCRRFPPNRPFGLDVERGAFAEVASHDWCGEFKLKASLRKDFEAEILTKLRGPPP